MRTEERKNNEITFDIASKGGNESKNMYLYTDNDKIKKQNKKKKGK